MAQLWLGRPRPDGSGAIRMCPQHEMGFPTMEMKNTDEFVRKGGGGGR